jgi:hypothetical protein
MATNDRADGRRTIRLSMLAFNSRVGGDLELAETIGFDLSRKSPIWSKLVHRFW